MNCRHCKKNLSNSFIDLETAPPSNAYLSLENMNAPETWFPLKTFVCDKCWLVQTEDYSKAEELFTESYAYFSSFSKSWLEHAKNYVDQMIGRFNLNSTSKVVEIASNDGYLLQYFKEQNIGCLGIEPTHSTAEAARKIGIETIEKFFGVSLAQELVKSGVKADLTAANNVLAHVPDINDFVKGFSILLKENGVATFEFPHLLQLIRYNQFDTIYHEHYSYLSLTAVQNVFNFNGLQIFDVEQLPTHGGSLRVFAQRSDTASKPTSPHVAELLTIEKEFGIQNLETYKKAQKKADKTKYELMQFLLECKANNKKVAAYGAAAKGNTLLNFCGVKSDLISFVVDKNPWKQNQLMPGSRIPIVDEAHIQNTKPDYIVILPWNLKTEIAGQLGYTRNWGCKFVIAIPEINVF